MTKVRPKNTLGECNSQFERDPRFERDSRSVEAVLDAAAKRLDGLDGERSTPATVASQLEAEGVKWAWQMAHMRDAHWDRLGMPLGLTLAVMAELAEPSTGVGEARADGGSGCCTRSTGSDDVSLHLQHHETEDGDDVLSPDEDASAIPDRIRQFLLLPDADGKEAKPLRSMSAVFLSLPITPADERQSMLLAVCELMALMSGLLLQTSFELRGEGAPSPAAGNIWAVAPNRADWMDMLVALIFLVDFMVAVFAVITGAYVAAAGHRADMRFCELVLNLVGILFAFFIIGVFFPILVLCFWRFFTDTRSPYPMLALVVIYKGLDNVVGGACIRFLFEALALEVYHTPKWFLRMCQSNAYFMGTSHLFEEKRLKEAAERRAAKLRARMTGGLEGESASSTLAGVAPGSG